jgi:predicted GTPase
MVHFQIIDTCGITENIHPDETIRYGMAQTVNLLRSADYIFHIVDAYSILQEDVNVLNTIDLEIYNYGMIRKCYTILANKMDLPTAKNNLDHVTSLFPKANVIPISALFNQGFKEVKACVARNI